MEFMLLYRSSEDNLNVQYRYNSAKNVRSEITKYSYIAYMFFIVTLLEK